MRVHDIRQKSRTFLYTYNKLALSKLKLRESVAGTEKKCAVFTTTLALRTGVIRKWNCQICVQAAGGTCPSDCHHSWWRHCTVVQIRLQRNKL